MLINVEKWQNWKNSILWTLEKFLVLAKIIEWSEGRSVVSNSLRPHGLYSPWNSPGQNTGVGSVSLLQGILTNSGIKTRAPALQVDCLQAEPQGKPKSTGVGSLSLLQWIFPTQESKRGLLHCWRILYQLSHKGRPYTTYFLKLTFQSQLWVVGKTILEIICFESLLCARPWSKHFLFLKIHI